MWYSQQKWDSRYNELTTGIRISSTKKTEPMYVNGEYYEYYPFIREEDINCNTGNLFVDTLKMSNLYLKGACADYDGDTVVLKIAYTLETNEELKNFANSKMNFIDLGCNNIRSFTANGDVVQSLYVFTKILENDKIKLSKPVFN